MSTLNSTTAGHTYGRVEREANDTVIFISEKERRIRFRYSGTSRQYPSAAEYRCTQCPVKALMINAQFRIVDPCAGHDCCLGAFHPQRTQLTDTANATTTESAQQCLATTALASRFSRPVKNTTKFIAKATYDANGCVQWPSERYTGTTLTFREVKSMSGRRRYFYCPGCVRKCSKYQTPAKADNILSSTIFASDVAEKNTSSESYLGCLKGCGISRRHLIVLDDTIIDHHPDDAGTNQGHICQQPLLQEKLNLMLRAMQDRLSETIDSLDKAAAEGTPTIAEIANGGNEDATFVPKIKVTEKHLSKLINVRKRSLAKRPRASGAESCKDKSLGKIRAVGPREPSPKRSCDVTHEAPSGHVGLTSIHVQSGNGSRTNTRLRDESDWIPVYRRAGVQVGLPRMRDSTVHQATTEQATVTRNDDGSTHSDLDLGPAVDALDELLQHPESIYSVSSASRYVASSRADTTHENEASANVGNSNNTTPSTLKTNGTSRFSGCAAASATRKRFGGSSVDVKPPTKKSPEVFTIDDSDDDNTAVSPSIPGESLRCPDSTYSVNSLTQHATGLHGSEADDISTKHLVVEEGQKPRRFDEGREDAKVDTGNTPTPTTQKTNGTSRVTCSAATSGTRKRFGGSSVDVKPPTKKSPEVLTIDDSDDDADAKGTSRTSKNPVKREPDENNDTQQLSKGPAEKFHRFIEEFKLTDEYLDYSINTRGKPRGFIQLPHVTHKWIDFDLRN